MQSLACGVPYSQSASRWALRDLFQSVLWEFVGLASARFGAGIAGYAIGRNFPDPLFFDVILSSVGGGSTQFNSDVLEGPSVDAEDW